MVPEHYQKCKAILEFESSELVYFYSFVVGCFLKYMMRYKYKGQPLEDLLKAKDYLHEANRRGTHYWEPLFPHQIEPLMIKAFKKKYEWLNTCLCVDKTGEIGYMCFDDEVMDKLDKFIDSEILKYTPEQTDSTESLP